MATTTILGTGIIGLSTAYYLSQHQPGSSIHLIESSPELFSSASGYAGGFLAKDWFPPATSSLGELSFEQHRLLAEKYGGRERWGYASTTSVRYTPSSDGGMKEERKKERAEDWLRGDGGGSRAEAAASSVSASTSASTTPLPARDDAGGTGKGKAPKWLRRTPGDEVEVIGEPDTAAQVDPLALCKFLLQECLAAGVQLHHPATAIGVSKDIRDEVASVRIADLGKSTEVELPCTRVVITAGAWSDRVFRTLFPLSGREVPVGWLAGHSILVRSPRWHGPEELGGKGERQREREGVGKEEACHALYTTVEPGFSPELFGRVGGTIYVAGLNDQTLPLPDVAGSVKPRRADIEKLKATAAELLVGSSGKEEGGDGGIEVVREGLCFRPVGPRGTPVVGRVKDEDLGIGIKTRPGAEGGVFVAAGHAFWGISLSLGTGMVVAEIVQGREVSADVGQLGLR